MALYAVGDIQGCYDPLARLLERVNFDTNKDTLLCVGDLVNRGPKSLKTLRLLKSLENQCVSVLGNHDIHLLSMIYGIRQPRPMDTLHKVLNAPDLTELSEWLRSRPLLKVLEDRKLILCHAGIYPWWSLEFAQQRAAEVEASLAKENKCRKLLGKIYSNNPRSWRDDLRKVERKRFTINTLTRMRFCSPLGNLNLKESGYVGKVTKTRIPWFDFTNPSLDGYKVVFGHWSALGFLHRPGFLGLDTGCVWGRELTMVKLAKHPSGPICVYTQENN